MDKPKTMSLQELARETSSILADIEETRRQIGLTKSEKRKSQLMRHIQKQQKKIKEITKRKRYEEQG